MFMLCNILCTFFVFYFCMSLDQKDMLIKRENANLGIRLSEKREKTTNAWSKVKAGINIINNYY